MRLNTFRFSLESQFSLGWPWRRPFAIAGCLIVSWLAEESWGLSDSSLKFLHPVTKVPHFYTSQHTLQYIAWLLGTDVNDNADDDPQAQPCAWGWAWAQGQYSSHLNWCSQACWNWRFLFSLSYARCWVRTSSSIFRFFSSHAQQIPPHFDFHCIGVASLSVAMRKTENKIEWNLWEGNTEFGALVNHCTESMGPRMLD